MKPNQSVVALQADPHSERLDLPGLSLAPPFSGPSVASRGLSALLAMEKRSSQIRWAMLGRLSSGRSSVLVRTLGNRLPETANPRPVGASVSLVQRGQRRLQVEDGNPTSPMTVNGSFAAQLHKLPERFKRRRSHIEFAALARFGNDRIENLPHVKRLSPIAAQEGENRLPPTLPRRVVLPVGFRGLDGLWRSRPYRYLRGRSPASRRCCQD
jgi:hypothetical protein